MNIHLDAMRCTVFARTLVCISNSSAVEVVKSFHDEDMTAVILPPNLSIGVSMQNGNVVLPVAWRFINRSNDLAITFNANKIDIEADCRNSNRWDEERFCKRCAGIFSTLGDLLDLSWVRLAFAKDSTIDMRCNEVMGALLPVNALKDSKLDEYVAANTFVKNEQINGTATPVNMLVNIRSNGMMDNTYIGCDINTKPGDAFNERVFGKEAVDSFFKQAAGFADAVLKLYLCKLGVDNK